MSNWDVAKPLDTDIVSQFPANERAARTALVSNFSVNHWGTNDANVGKHSTINLLDQGADPALVAGQGNIYSKSISAASELFWRSTAGAALQLTSGAGINPAVLTSVPAASLTGTVIDARLSANVPLLNVSNNFIVSNAGTAATIFANTNAGAAALSLIGIQNNAGNILQLFTRSSAGTPANQGVVQMNDGPLLVQSVSGTLSLVGSVINLNGVNATDFARLSQSNTFTGATQGIDNDIGIFRLRTTGGTSRLRIGTLSGDQFITSDNSGATLALATTGGGAITLNGVNITDYARLSQSNTFTSGTQVISAAGPIELQLTPTSASDSRLKLSTNLATRGYVGAVGAAANLIAGSVIGDLIIRAESGRILFSNDAGTTAAHALGATAGTSSIAGIGVNDFARLSVANAFTANQTVTAADARVNVSDGTIQGYIRAPGSGSFMYVGATSNHGINFIANNTVVASISSAGAYDFKGGTVTSNNASASEVGYKGLPQNSQSVSYTTVLADCNKNLHQTGATKTFTIDSNANVAAPIGTVLNFTCDNATGVSIAITTDTLRLAGTATTGTRTLAQYGVATAIKILATTWLISGAGLS